MATLITDAAFQAMIRDEDRVRATWIRIKAEEILPLKSFPDYIDYLPKGSIVRKIGVMGYLPDLDKSINKFITMSKDEYANFVKDTIQLVVKQFAEKNLI